MPPPSTEVERRGRTAIVHLRGDFLVSTTGALDALLRTLLARADVQEIRLDFAEIGRLDSSMIAVVELARRAGRHAIVLDGLAERERGLFEALAPPAPPAAAAAAAPRASLGERVLQAGAGLEALLALVRDTARGGLDVVLGRARLPAGSVSEQVLVMGANAVFIVGLLTFLLGMSIAFQSAVQLRKFGAGVFVSDLVGLSMVREFGPLVTAIVVTGRTGAAIAAELGTMQVNSEIDALAAIGVNPTRYLVMPRLVALTIIQPVLTLMAMFVGIAGGMVVAELVLHTSPAAFWSRTVALLDLGDFGRGIAKSFAFAWIIGLAGAHLGLRARRDASGVGAAATRAVVAAVFCIIVFDAAFESLLSMRAP